MFYPLQQMVHGIVKGFKVHELKGVFIPQDGNFRRELLIPVPELKQDGEKREQGDLIAGVRAGRDRLAYPAQPFQNLSQFFPAALPVFLP